MKEKLDSLGQAARNLADRTQEKVSGGAGAVRDAVGRIGDIGQLGNEATQGLTEDLNELLPAIKRAGYHVQGIDLDVAIPPRVAVHCHLQTQVSEGDRQALLAALEGRRIASAAIQALFRVSDLQKNLAVGTLQASDIILELGMSPAVRVRYREQQPGSAC